MFFVDPEELRAITHLSKRTDFPSSEVRGRPFSCLVVVSELTALSHCDEINPNLSYRPRLLTPRLSLHFYHRTDMQSVLVDQFNNYFSTATGKLLWLKGSPFVLNQSCDHC